ncbi:hypothetical protein SDC9_150421 [bioreactor metagenome]|uniref:Uncharacterized protein n=1 Tax=bioreactor metagenome TaxID=1076179 RepID=A0A645EMF8_9ZZZZ
MFGAAPWSNYVVIGRCFFFTGEHRSHQVFSVLPAGPQHASDMQGDQAEQCPRQIFVQIGQPAVAPEHVGGVEPACEGEQRQAGEQRHHHPAAQRVVADIARRLAGDDVTRIVQRGVWRAHELREACVTGADRAPQQARDEDADNDIARALMRGAEVFATPPG